jgi:hypothetical protein
MPYKEGTVKVFANKIITNEVLAQGDGSQTTFNLTLVKAPCFINSLTLSYTVGATVYQATSNASYYGHSHNQRYTCRGWQHPGPCFFHSPG